MATHLAPAQAHDEPRRAASTGPSLRRALLVLAAYALIVPGGELLLGTDAEQVKESARSALTGLVLPLAAGILVVLAIGGRRRLHEVLVEPRHLRLAAPRPLWIVPPLLGIATVAVLATAPWGDWQTEVVLLIVLGALLVGVAEELVFRGFLLAGARTRYSERGAFLLTCGLFGLVHGANVLAGQALAPTLGQVVFATAMGAAFYLLRRLSGALAIPMLAHGLVDVLSFVSAPPA